MIPVLEPGEHTYFKSMNVYSILGWQPYMGVKPTELHDLEEQNERQEKISFEIFQVIDRDAIKRAMKNSYPGKQCPRKYPKNCSFTLNY